jgi:hypothetical protein
MSKKRNGAPAATTPEGTPQAAEQPKGNRPIHEVRLGRIRASIWLNTNSKQETWYSVTLTRGYKDSEGQWRNSHSLGLDDLLVAGEVLKAATLWIYAERQGEHRPAQSEEVSDGQAASVDIPF